MGRRRSLVQVQSPRPQKCYSDLISDQVEMRKTESASQPDVKLFAKLAEVHFLFGRDEGKASENVRGKNEIPYVKNEVLFKIITG